jgi:predicted  nucleic acid-binding Zn-ribbon protein
MSQIDELQGRITSAMARISQGLEALPQGEVADPEDLARVKSELEEEKLANAQLEERLRAIKAKHAAELKAASEGGGGGDPATLERLDSEIQRLRVANDQLAASNTALREANEAGVGEPHLINKAMLTQLESLRAERAADRAEAGAIMGQLGPLLEAAKSLPEGEEA